MTCGIYRIQCAGNGIVYVGQSVNIEARWSKHLSLLRAARAKTNRRLFRSAKKYGIESVTMDVLEECGESILTEREQYWLDAMRDQCGSRVVNAVGPVDNPRRGTRLTQEQRAKLSERHRGKSIPSICGAANPSCRPEARARMRTALNPAKRPEVRAKMRGNSGMARMVRCPSTGQSWLTMTECAKDLGVSVAAVHAAATKKNPTVKGLVLDRSAPGLLDAMRAERGGMDR